ncbi:MAG: hypothetical protein U9R38_05465 [Candidatus Margulisiibacteriota bacterium]|nr:hypothetical protein [Candidatus Margulisiibacteriota bacterium]
MPAVVPSRAVGQATIKSCTGKVVPLRPHHVFPLLKDLYTIQSLQVKGKRLLPNKEGYLKQFWVYKVSLKRRWDFFGSLKDGVSFLGQLRMNHQECNQRFPETVTLELRFGNRRSPKHRDAERAVWQTLSQHMEQNAAIIPEITEQAG